MKESDKEQEAKDFLEYLKFHAAHQKKIDEDSNRFWNKLGEYTLGKIDHNEFIAECERIEEEEGELWKEWKQKHKND